MTAVTAWVCGDCTARWAAKLSAGCPRCHGELTPVTGAVVRRVGGTVRKGKATTKRPVARG